MKTETISQSSLVDFLMGITHAEPVTITALIAPEVRKTDNPYSSILKVSHVNAFTASDYGTSVNRQLAREGKEQLTFTPKPRKWGVRVAPALVENKGKFYIPLQIQHTRKPFYLARVGHGFLYPIAKEAIAAFLPPVTHATNQGTEKEIVYREYSLGSIITLNAKGHRFRLRPE